jgi:hypothetical protein
MLFKKLFRLLVLGGAMVGSGSGCAGAAQSQAGADKGDDRDGGSRDDGGSAQAQDADGGTAADAGSAGGVQGW